MEEISFPLKHEHVEVEAKKADSTNSWEYHIAVLRNVPHLKEHDRNSLNVMAIMLDSYSHSNAKRKLKNYYSELEKDENAILFNGHTVVGDGTTAQIAGQLTGMDELDLPEARKGKPGADTVDKYRWIFKDAKKAGYMTVFAEEDVWTGTFNYRLKGFRDPPTDKYTRPFWLKAQAEQVRTHVSCLHTTSIRHAERVWDVFHDKRKLAWILLGNCCHNGHTHNPDDELMKLKRNMEGKGYLNNTVLIVFGDHGIRIRKTLTEKLEERLVFFSMLFPPWFKTAHPEMFANLRMNRNILTSHYDVYPTLHHLMDLKRKDIPTFPVSKEGHSYSLLSDIAKHNRSCKTAGVRDHWCPCLNEEQLSVTSPVVVRIGELMVERMNGFLCANNEVCTLCSELKLSSVKMASRQVANQDMLDFVETKHAADGNCDNCVFVKAKEKHVERKFHYELTLEALPSMGVFEISAEVTMGSDGKSVESVSFNEKQVSRISRYGHEPDCISAKYASLNGYCYCKDYKPAKS